jgi:hypothetical protein
MKCPCCGFEEPFYWHYPTHHGLEMPYARIQELREQTPELAEKIEKATPLRIGVLEYTDANYAYKYNIKSGFVRRRELALWKAAKWRSIPMEKRERFIPGKQIKLKVFSSVGGKST